jgi:hypothetical protein
MNHFIITRSLAGCLALAAALAVTGATGGAQSVPGAAGHWEGQISMPEREVGIVVDLSRGKAGGWIGSISIPGSTSIDVPLSNIVVAGSAVRFFATLPESASFDGVLSSDARGLTGKVSNSQGGVPFQLARHGEARVSVPPPSSALAKEFEGTWDGTLAVGGTVRHVGLRIAPAADGSAVGTLIAVDHGGREIPVTTVTLRGNQLQLEVRAISGVYRGTLGADGEIAGEWTERGAQGPLTFKRATPASRKP